MKGAVKRYSTGPWLVRFLPLGETFEEKMERIELLYEQIQAYKVTMRVMRHPDLNDVDLLKEEVERLRNFLEKAMSSFGRSRGRMTKS